MSWGSEWGTHHTKEELSERIQFFVEGEQEHDCILRSLDLDAQIDISGSRKLRLFIADSQYTYPNNYYKIENLTLEKIKERIYRTVNEFEYCWINGNALNLEQNIEFEIKTA